MKSGQNHRRTTTPAWILRREDQIAVAVVVLLGVIGTVCWWLAHGGCRGTFMELKHSPPRQATFQVDINTADWPELAQLPQIGETLARRIVAHRGTHGRFRSHDELVQIKGIGDKKLDQIRPYLLPIAPSNDEPPELEGP